MSEPEPIDPPALDLPAPGPPALGPPAPGPNGLPPANSPSGTTQPRTGYWRTVYRRTPWWLKVLLIFVAARIVTTVMLLALAAAQGANPWTGAHPDYFSYAAIWDGNWYHIVSVFGYPAQLPMAGGFVAENAWAFMPGYPVLVGLITALTGVPWQVIAVVVSLGFGLGQALVFYRLMRLVLADGGAMFSVVLLCMAPLSPLMQLAYAESMAMFFLTVGLYLLVRRRYWALIPVVTVFGFSRPLALAFALTLLVHLVWRWVRQRAFPVRERVAAASATAYSGVVGLAWSAIAWLVTGRPTAYFDTELAWRADYIGHQPLAPFTPWFASAAWWMGPGLGTMVVMALIIAFCLLLWAPGVRRLGFDLRVWVASYGLYLLAVFFPQSSTFRLLVPMFPLVGAAALPRSVLYRVAVVVLSVAGQLGWLLLCWGVDGADWTPP